MDDTNPGAYFGGHVRAPMMRPPVKAYVWCDSEAFAYHLAVFVGGELVNVHADSGRVNSATGWVQDRIKEAPAGTFGPMTVVRCLDWRNSSK